MILGWIGGLRKYCIKGLDWFETGAGKNILRDGASEPW